LSPSDAKSGELWLVRHGETEWSKSGQHTGRTDVPLTETGREQAKALGELLGGHEFARVLTSPLSRATDTCRLAGYGDRAEVTDDLREWDYGDYEGEKTVDIRKSRPGWTIWSGDVPAGETAEQVAARAQRVIDRTSTAGGDVALFAHGHVLRVLAATWLGLPPGSGRLFALGTATLSVLGHERETRVISLWNRPAHMS
jgi:broad specificity phosphatase PhoE